MEKIELRPIGHVRNVVRTEVRDERVSEIILGEDLVEALEGIEYFSHVFVMFWMLFVSTSKDLPMTITIP